MHNIAERESFNVSRCHNGWIVNVHRLRGAEKVDSTFVYHNHMELMEKIGLLCGIIIPQTDEYGNKEKL